MHDKRGYRYDQRLGQLLKSMDVMEFFKDYWGKHPVKLETDSSDTQ
jgi:hypothetical protein